MNRWCIIAGPRSGSTYIECMIYNALYSLPSMAKLGEFMTANFGADHQIYGLDQNRCITVTEIDAPLATDPDTIESFYQNRVSLIKSAKRSQPLTMRLFCLPNAFTMERYLKFCSILQDLDFQFLSLERDLFDRTVSFYFMLNHGRIHRFIRPKSDEVKVAYQLNGNLPPSPTKVNIKRFMALYRQVVEDDRNRREITKILECPIIRYSHALEDLKSHGVPMASWIPTKLTYDEKYPDLILNYQELLKAVAKEKS